MIRPRILFPDELPADQPPPPDQPNDPFVPPPPSESDDDLSLSSTDLLPPTTKVDKTAPWGDPCIDLPTDNEDVLRIYCQNVNGIFDPDGKKLDEAFYTMQSTGASIFTFNETHGDDLNPKTKKLLRKSQHRIWQKRQGFSHIQTSSSKAAVASFTKPGGNMVGIIGNLCGRVRERINDEYGRWCGFTVLGKDGRDILILTVYNVSQDYDAGDNTLYRQQQSQYLNDYNCSNVKTDRATYIDPKKRFVKDLRIILETA